MKQKIKTWLIHWLGGMTQEESDERVCKAYQRGCERGKQIPLPQSEYLKCGIRLAYESTKDYARTLYGIDPELWCKEMWNYINTQIQKFQ